MMLERVIQAIFRLKKGSDLNQKCRGNLTHLHQEHVKNEIISNSHPQF